MVDSPVGLYRCGKCLSKYVHKQGRMVPCLCSVIPVVKLTLEQHIFISSNCTERTKKHSKYHEMRLENLYTVLESSFNSCKFSDGRTSLKIEQC